MKSALWVKWTESWDTKLVVCPPIPNLDAEHADRVLVQAELARRLFNAVPAGNA